MDAGGLRKNRCGQKSAYSNGTASAETLRGNAVHNVSGGEASQCQQTSLRTCC